MTFIFALSEIYGIASTICDSIPSPMNPLRQTYFIATLFVLVGVGCLIAGVVVFFHTRAFITSAKTTSGRVVRLDPDTDNHHNIIYHTVFTFTDDSGSPHTIRTSYAQRPQPYRIGDPVTILYQPASPESARIRSFGSLWLAPTILGSVGVIFPTVALLAFSAARRTYGAV
jgi:hypothetical protein